MEQIMLCRRDPEFAEVMRRADLVVPDGIPVIWMSRLNRTPLPERVTGVDLVPALCEAAAKRGLRVFFLGAAPGVADEVAQRLSQRYPGLVVAGTYSPPMLFENDPEENRRTIQRVVEARPHFLFVAFGAPRQEKWIRRHRAELDVPLTIGVGAAFNFIVGRERRAPQWVLRVGLESFWRMTQQPVKILGRLFRNAPLFFLFMLDKKTYRSQKSFLLRIRPIILAGFDAIVAAGSFLLSYALYFRVLFPHLDPYPGEPITQVPAYSTLVPFVVLINFLAILGTGLYERRPRGSYLRLLNRTAVSATATLVLLVTFTFACKGIFVPYLKGYSRGLFGLFGFLNFAGLLVIRSGVRKMEAVLHRRGLVADRLILIGNPVKCEEFAAPLLDRLSRGQMPLGGIRRPEDPASPDGLLPDLGSLADLRKIVGARKIDEIVIVDSSLSAEEMAAVLEACGEFGVRLSFLPGLPRMVEGRFRVREVGPRKVLSVDGQDLRRMWSERQFKGSG